MTLRCAIYTRKSSEEGLDQDFNSLHAQREACEAYVLSQKHEGWTLIRTAYDDGGLSGGTMQRPALQRLLADIEANRVDIIVVYKVDRLTRSLADFARMVELFDRNRVSFVSVTQQFNTTSSMGRLTLNVLLSFAQFEREVTGERIRDKIRASKAKGIWMGGRVPLGYKAEDRILVIEPDEAETVRQIFTLYLEAGNIPRLAERLKQLRIKGRDGAKTQGFRQGALLALLRNPIYIGKIRHKTLIHEGLHDPIIEPVLWEAVQTRLAINGTDRIQRRRREDVPLRDKLFDARGQRLVPGQSMKQGRRYRYYISEALRTKPDPEGWRVPARTLEAAILTAARATLTNLVKIAKETADFSPSDISMVTRTIQHAPPTDAFIFDRILGRADLRSDGITLTLDLKPLASEFESRPQPMVLTHRVPMEIQRRGVEMQLVIRGPSNLPAAVDAALVKTLARARTWWESWLRGEVESLREIAIRNGVSKSYVGDVIKLAFLSPAIVEAILKGHQPATLGPDRLAKLCPLPLCWDRQKRALAIV